MRSIVFCVPVFIAFLSLGCSDVERLDLPESSLQGSILFKGKPVPHALVLVSGDSFSSQAFADEEGKFLVENCPSGSVKIGVNTEAGRGNMMSAMMAARVQGDKSAAPKFVDLPQKYFDPETSGIETTLEDPTGLNTYDIEID